LGMNWWLAALSAIWTCGVLVVVIRFTRGWWKVYAAKRAARPLALAADVPVLCSPSLIEPGIFGVFRPVLLLPEGIPQKLTPEQLRAIIAHEMCHVRRRDSLTFALHMIVETLFWFHPAVWWVGVRLIEERERACDEAVVESGSHAPVYAESILQVCKFYVESPVACVAGVTGADLKKRIMRIMTDSAGSHLSWRKRILLGVAVLVAVAVPVALGLAQSATRSDSPAADAQSAAGALPAFDVVSIKPGDPNQMKGSINFTPDGMSIGNLSLDMLLRQAFKVSSGQLVGLPPWAKNTRYDIEAKVAAEDAPQLKNLKEAERWAMLVPVFEERFGLKYHHETRDLTVYTLMIAKGGAKMKQADPASTYPNGFRSPGGYGGAGMMRAMPGEFIGQSVPLENLVRSLSAYLGSTIVDKTGLTGKFDFDLKWDPAEQGGAMMMAPGGGPPEAASAPDATGPTLFTALEEQLGLKLEAHKEPVDVIVIDHVEQPSAN